MLKGVYMKNIYRATCKTRLVLQVALQFLALRAAKHAIFIRKNLYKKLKNYQE